MRAFLVVYFAVGLLLAGGAAGEKLKACPDAWHHEIGASLVYRALDWPALTLAVLMAWDSAPKTITCN